MNVIGNGEKMFSKSITKKIALLMAMLTVFSTVSCSHGNVENPADTSEYTDTSYVADTTEAEETKQRCKCLFVAYLYGDSQCVKG